MGETDLELLARYSRQNAEDAFSEVVRRHIDLVYSAALRQVRSHHLAEEVSQSAFLKLASHASDLPPHTIVTAWLYQVTRREAIDVVRREARRESREQIASEMNPMNATDDDWAQIAPLLDDAMHALDQTDRAAVLLRYFENKSLREVGAALGTSDDAAQKRVSRAVERLRDVLSRHGVAAGAGAVTTVLSTHAVQAAPAKLATTISVNIAAGATLATIATSTLTKTIVMTTLQKASLTTVAVLVLAATTALVIHWRDLHQMLVHRTLRPLSSANTRQTEFPQATWKFAGYADPEAAYQSFMWAMSQGDVETTLSSLTPAERAKWEGNMKKTKAEYSAQWAQRTKGTELFRILDKQIVSDTETHLQIESVGASNKHPVQEQWARMIKVGRDWKYEGWVGN